MKIRREVRIGLVVLAGLALLFWGLNFLKGRSFLANERHFFAIYSHISGLEEANPIMLNGMKIGQVDNISFIENDPDARLIVDILIKVDLDFPVSSIARIYSIDPLGSKGIEIQRSDTSLLMMPGDTFVSAIEPSLTEQVSKQMLPLKAKSEALIQSFDSVLAVVQYVFNESTRDNLSKTFESIKLTIQNLENTSYNIDTLVNKQRGRFSEIITNVSSISTNIRDNNEKITSIITNFATISDTVAALDFARTMALTNKSLLELNESVTKINQGSGSLGMLVNDDSLYLNIQRSADELDLLLEDLRMNPQRYLHFSVFGRGPRQNKYYAPVEAKKD